MWTVIFAGLCAMLAAVVIKWFPVKVAPAPATAGGETGNAEPERRGCVGQLIDPFQSRAMQWLLAGGLVMTSLILCARTSYVYVPDGKSGHRVLIWGAAPLTGGKIIAVNGEMGPQANLLSPGLHLSPFYNLFYDVEMKDNLVVPAGMCITLVAADGLTLPPGETFAEHFKSDQVQRMVEDAEFFLGEGKGFKGPQVTVLPPGTYRLNRYLWKTQEVKSVVVKAGESAVIKSAERSRVYLPGLETPEKPQKTEPVELPLEVKDVGRFRPKINLYEVGAKGTWHKPLGEGIYYLNPDCYVLTNVDNKLQTWELKGGFTQRELALTFDQEGGITQSQVKKEIPVPTDALGGALSAQVEGWTVHAELRIVLRIEPHHSPYVVVSVGGMEKVRDTILIPEVKSIAREVLGGANIKVQEEKDGKFVDVERRVKILDLVEHREILQKRILELIKPKGLDYGVTFTEVAFGQIDIPPEMLVQRRREQIAGQLKAAYEQEKKAQDARILSEKSKAQANQQMELVKAEIELERSSKQKESEKNRGEGAKLRLTLQAEGEQAQKDVLGAEGVIKLAMWERALKLIEERPQVMESLARIHLPERITIANGGGLDAAAAILGEALAPRKKDK
jgi:hypothetical protein